MKIIVLDLEMNQPSDLIIQIGAICLDLKTGTRLGGFDCFANPGELPSQFITELTGITTDDIESSPPLDQVLMDFWTWCEGMQCGMQLGAWGGDVNELIEQSKTIGIWKNRKYPKNLNIKELSKVYRAALPQSKKSGGLRATMEAFGMEFEGEQHRAYTDAYNTARLLRRFYLLSQLGITSLKSAKEIC